MCIIETIHSPKLHNNISSIFFTENSNLSATPNEIGDVAIDPRPPLLDTRTAKPAQIQREQSSKSNPTQSLNDTVSKGEGENNYDGKKNCQVSSSQGLVHLSPPPPPPLATAGSSAPAAAIVKNCLELV
ncbi:hypothetical protein Ahy_B10g106292 isoform C [Arachis hypogaea]|uniref:Uncharacterized protein n=1 Tax=Arachis hypogaea TaxID=3818 RepID=A0A444XAD5_ARAHY|nr:hypothetical protein Ahy_B10g106292 isoform C [Arachis hypogaea]